MTHTGPPPIGIDDKNDPTQRILGLVEAALQLSDDAGYAFVAIDLSSARDKLMVLSRDLPSTKS